MPVYLGEVGLQLGHSALGTAQDEAVKVREHTDLHVLAELLRDDLRDVVHRTELHREDAHAVARTRLLLPVMAEGRESAVAPLPLVDVPDAVVARGRGKAVARRDPLHETVQRHAASEARDCPPTQVLLDYYVTAALRHHAPYHLLQRASLDVIGEQPGAVPRHRQRRRRRRLHVRRYVHYPRLHRQVQTALPAAQQQDVLYRDLLQVACHLSAVLLQGQGEVESVAYGQRLE